MLHDLIQLRLYIAKCKVTNKLFLACNNSSIVNMIQLMHVTRQCKKTETSKWITHTAFCCVVLSITISFTIDYRRTARV